jgi:hypothetical protein
VSRWFRFYDEALDDDKVQMLSDAHFRAWVNLLCLASKNDGILPPLERIAFRLRKSIEETSDILNDFYAHQLLDHVELDDAPITYSPHNWNKRQYKSDVSTDRVKRFRKRDRNVSETPPETEADTETEQKDSEAKASGADAPIDPSIAERELFQRGRELLGKSAGGQITKLLRAKGGNVALARSALELAATKDKPAEFIAASIRGPPLSARPLTEFQRKQAETNDVRAVLRNFGGEGGGQAVGLLPDDSGKRPEAVCDGDGATVRVLPRRSG